MWSHPHITLASYTKEHPSSSDVVVRCQTTGAVSAEQGLVEALQIAKEMLGAVSAAMDAAVDEWRAGGHAVPGGDAGGGGGEAMDADE